MKKDKLYLDKTKDKQVKSQKIKPGLTLFRPINIDKVKLINLIVYKKYLKIHIDAYFHRKVDDMLADTYRYKELAFLAQ